MQASQSVPAGNLSIATQRIKSDLAEIKEIKNYSMPCSLIQNENLKVKGNLANLKGTLYEGALIPYIIEFTDQYPYTAPTFKFMTGGLFHPNVNLDNPNEGRMCIEKIFHWAVTYRLKDVLDDVYKTIQTPDLNNVGNPAAAVDFQDPDPDKKNYKAKVQAYLEKFNLVKKK